MVAVASAAAGLGAATMAEVTDTEGGAEDSLVRIGLFRALFVPVSVPNPFIRNKSHVMHGIFCAVPNALMSICGCTVSLSLFLGKYYIFICIVRAWKYVSD